MALLEGVLLESLVLKHDCNRTSGFLRKWLHHRNRTIRQQHAPRLVLERRLPVLLRPPALQAALTARRICLHFCSLWLRVLDWQESVGFNGLENMLGHDASGGVWAAAHGLALVPLAANILHRCAFRPPAKMVLTSARRI